MMGFMGKEECARMAEQQAMDDIRRRRLRKMLKTRRINKGELVNGRIDLVGLFRFSALLYPGGASPAGGPEEGSRPLLIHQNCFTLFDVVCGPSFTQPHLHMPTCILLPPRAPVVYPQRCCVFGQVITFVSTLPPAPPERKRQQLSRIRDARKTASRGRGFDSSHKIKQAGGAPEEEPAGAPETSLAEAPQPSHDHTTTSDEQRSLSEDRPDSPGDGRGVADSDVICIRTRSPGASSAGVGGASEENGDGGDGGRVPREKTKKAGARGNKAGYSDEVLAERMAHLLSQRYLGIRSNTRTIFIYERVCMC